VTDISPVWREAPLTVHAGGVSPFCSYDESIRDTVLRQTLGRAGIQGTTGENEIPSERKNNLDSLEREIADYMFVLTFSCSRLFNAETYFSRAVISLMVNTSFRQNFDLNEKSFRSDFVLTGLNRTGYSAGTAYSVAIRKFTCYIRNVHMICRFSITCQFPRPRIQLFANSSRNENMTIERFGKYWNLV